MMGQTVSNEIVISNTSGVAFDFNVNVSSLKYKKFIQISPMKGCVDGYSKQKIAVKVTPLLPIQFREEFNLQIAYFTPQTVSVSLDVLCSEIIVDLPRDVPVGIGEKLEYQTLMKTADDNIRKQLQIMYDNYKEQQQEQEQKAEETPRDEIEAEKQEPQKDANEIDVAENNEDENEKESKEVEEVDIENQNEIEEEKKDDTIVNHEIDINYIHRELDKMQYVDVLSNLLNNYYDNDKHKSKRIAFSNKDLKAGYDKSNLISLFIDTLQTEQEKENENDDKISNIECDFNIYQFKSIGSIRYRPFELMIGYYLLSFGNVVHSLSSNKKFTLKNQDLFHYFTNQVINDNNNTSSSKNTQQSLIIEFDKQLLGYTPFNITPPKQIKITPKSSFDFVVTYNPTKKVQLRPKSQELSLIGPQKFSIPFRVGSGNGPCFCLNIAINIRIPNLEIQSPQPQPVHVNENATENASNPSETEHERSFLDFGDVLVGQCKDLYIRFVKKEKVDSEWKLDTLEDKLLQKSNKKAWNPATQFLIEPKIGKLAPTQFMDVRIRYTPKQSGTTNIKFPLMVMHNEMTKFVVIKGNGIRRTITLDPSPVRFDPVLPSTASEPIQFKIKNTSNSDVVIYSLDFDQQYKNEEELLSKIKWPSGNKILVPPSISGANELEKELKQQSLLCDSKSVSEVQDNTKVDDAQNEEKVGDDEEKEQIQQTSIIAMINDAFYDIDKLKTSCKENEIIYITINEIADKIESLTADDIHEDQHEALEQLKSNLMDNDSGKQGGKYLSEMMTFFLPTINNPKYLILDVGECMAMDRDKQEEDGNADDKEQLALLNAEWISSFKGLSHNPLISYFGIAEVEYTSIDDLQQKFEQLQTKWTELFENIPYDQFEPTDEDFNNDLQTHELSLEEYQSLLSQPSHDKEHEDQEAKEELARNVKLH